jgi:hypothetical protein
MALTDHCDVFVSVLEGGVNRVFVHVQRQWPSLFNYGSPNVVHNRQLQCRPIDAHPIVDIGKFPPMTAFPPLPVDLSGTYGLDFCAQLVKAVVDFHPGNTIALPPELAPLDPQRFSIQVALCAGIACPPRQLVDSLPIEYPQKQKVQILRDERRQVAEPRGPIQVLPSRGMECFCVDAFVEGGVIFVTGGPLPRIQGTIDGIEIVDLKPDALESAIECYALTFAKVGLLPLLSIPTQDIEDAMGARITISVAGTSPPVPNNPAIENDQIKVFFKVAASPIPPAPPGGPGGPTPPAPPPPNPGVPRPRVRGGPFDLTMAASEKTVNELFAVIRDGIKINEANTVNFGPFTAGYAFGVHLEGGSVDLRGDGTIDIKDVKLKWDQAKVFAGIDIPGFCIGGFCIIWSPWGCVIRAPKLCVFDDNPDIGIKLDLSGLITSKISLNIKPFVLYSTNHPNTVTAPWDALATQTPNLWEVVIRINRADLEPIVIADTVGALLEAAIDAAISNALGPLPGWAKDLILSIFGPLIDLVTSVLGIADDVAQWLIDLLGLMNAFDVLVTAIADGYVRGKPLVSVPDPYAVDEAPKGLLPLMIPVEFVGVRVTDAELIVEADIGG